MSTIGSNSEDLILNADGGSSTIKLKINGTEKASVSSAGAFTSTTIDATKLTGNLPAISAASLTNVPKDTTVGGRKNIIINGAMNIAQRGTSAADTGRKTMDRFTVSNAGNDEYPTQSQHALTSSDTEVWAKGFRYSYHLTNGNQTDVGGADRVCFQYHMEAQDIATSGWDYTSSSSYITLSFWCKSSVAQNFYGRLESVDGTSQGYAFETGSLTANAWTKVTKTIAGNSNLTFDNNNGHGLSIEIVMFRGTDKTGTRPLNAWAAFDGATRVPDMTSTWYTTNDATFEITGVQLEVGSTATDFEHRSYGEELALCQRYFCKSGDPTTPYASGSYHFYSILAMHGTSNAYMPRILFPVSMRASPTVVSGSIQSYNGSIWQTWNGSNSASKRTDGFTLGAAGGLSVTLGESRLSQTDWTADAEI